MFRYVAVSCDDSGLFGIGCRPERCDDQRQPAQQEGNSAEGRNSPQPANPAQREQVQGAAEQATAGIGMYLAEQSFSDSRQMCHLIQGSSGRILGWASWDFDLANTGQTPDISKCKACTESLPTDYPHTIPNIAGVAGRSPWANHSGLDNVGQIDDEGYLDNFYTSQIYGGIEYLSPELCPWLDNQDVILTCGSSILP